MSAAKPEATTIDPTKDDLAGHYQSNEGNYTLTIRYFDQEYKGKGSDTPYAIRTYSFFLKGHTPKLTEKANKALFSSQPHSLESDGSILLMEKSVDAIAHTGVMRTTINELQTALGETFNFDVMNDDLLESMHHTATRRPAGARPAPQIQVNRRDYTTNKEVCRIPCIDSNYTLIIRTHSPDQEGSLFDAFIVGKDEAHTKELLTKFGGLSPLERDGSFMLSAHGKTVPEFFRHLDSDLKSLAGKGVGFKLDDVHNKIESHLVKSEPLRPVAALRQKVSQFLSGWRGKPQDTPDQRLR